MRPLFRAIVEVVGSTQNYHAYAR